MNSVQLDPNACQHIETPPEWAVLQRRLFAKSEAALDMYLAKYTREDGSLIYRSDWVQGRDGLDDLYEAFRAIPSLYLLGGSDRLLALAHKQWEAVTMQGTDFGLADREYEIGYDQFHQSEGNVFFFDLCAADPDNPKLIERAKCFADFFTGKDAQARNYDAVHNILRSPHNGSKGPRFGYYDFPENDDDIRPFNARMHIYGLPLQDVPGITHFDQISMAYDSSEVRQNTKRMYQAMNTRMGRGDTAANLPVASLVTNAFMITGDTRFADWVQTYIGGWWQRAKDNGGVLPDNVGPGGKVGELFHGNWYGAAYGWSWPHGLDNLLDASYVAAQSLFHVTGDDAAFDVPRRLIDDAYDRGRVVHDHTEIYGANLEPWIEHSIQSTGDPSAFVMTQRYSDEGWFDEMTLRPAAPISIWATTREPKDWERFERQHELEPQDWSQSFVFHSKGDDGHERPWTRYVASQLETYPMQALKHALASIDMRVAAIQSDKSDLSEVHIHHWQNHDPLTNETLIQLTLGGPQRILNGGLYATLFRHFDTNANRSGLPPDVAALVEHVDTDQAILHLVNLSKSAARSITSQAGFYGEHRFSELTVDGKPVGKDHNSFTLSLPPSSQLSVNCRFNFNVRRGSYTNL